MYEAVEDGVGERGVAQVGMPLVDGKLAGDEGGGALVAVVEDVEQVAHGLVGERREPEVVDDEQVDAGVDIPPKRSHRSGTWEASVPDDGKPVAATG